MVRANQGHPDSRVEKEIYSLSKENEVELLGWNRTKNNKQIENKNVVINGKKFIYHLVCINAPQGAGLRKTLFPMLKFWMRITNYLKKYQYKYDVIHFCDFDTAALAFSVINHKKVKVVYDIFDYYADAHAAPKIMDQIIRYRENSIINKSDMVILCNEKRKKQILPAYNNNTVILHNAPSTVTSLEKLELKGEKGHEKKRLVYVGMLSDERYLREIADVVSKRSDVEWHVGGFGNLKPYFEKLSKKYNNIFFYGKLNYSQVLYLEKHCDIMTALYDPKIPNHRYAAPNKFYESLMLGKPLIMVKNTGMDQWIKKYHLGVVIDTKKESFCTGFNKALNELCEINDTEPLHQRATNIYSNKFSWDIMEKRLLKAYEAL